MTENQDCKCQAEASETFSLWFLLPGLRRSAKSECAEMCTDFIGKGWLELDYLLKPFPPLIQSG